MNSKRDDLSSSRESCRQDKPLPYFRPKNLDGRISKTTFFNLPDIFWRHIRRLQYYCEIAVEFKSRAM